jgi:glycosyltransferase involved in cell wall biosynthesis
VARVLILSFSDHGRDPRVHRQLEALGERHELFAAGFGAPAMRVPFVDLRPPSAPLAARRSQALGLVRVLARRFESAYWRNRTHRFALGRLEGRRFDAVVANDVDTLPLALRLAGPAPVIFDAHEYYPDHFVQVWWWRLLLRPHFRYLCRRYMPRAAAVTTVSPGLAERYLSELGVRAEVLLNAPAAEALEPTPVELPIRLFHHGVADRRRNLERTIELLRLLDERFTLELMLIDDGTGELDRLRRLAAEDERISFRAPVPMAEIARVANAHDIGVFLLPPRTPNQLHVLPNKLFEFIQGRLAVAIGPSPEMAAAVERYGCGVVAEDFSAAALARALAELDPERVAELKRRSSAAAAELTSERAAARLNELVERALESAPA